MKMHLKRINRTKYSQMTCLVILIIFLTVIMLILINNKIILKIQLTIIMKTFQINSPITKIIKRIYLCNLHIKI
jgi:hypothetical protein